MYVAEVLYRKCVPGLKGTVCARKVLAHGSFGRRDGSVWCPVDMRKRSLKRIDLMLLLASFGASSGKNLSTGSSMLNFPSAAAIPTAVEVKLLLRENREWRASGVYGDHQPSATTWPCLTSMKLWSEAMFLSAASTNARTAEEETPCASGLLRGRSAPKEGAAPRTTSATNESSLIPDLTWRREGCQHLAIDTGRNRLRSRAQT